MLQAVREAWVSPSWQQRREVGGAWFVEGSAEAPLRHNESPEAFTERLSIAVWRRLGRFVKVVVDVSIDDSDEHQRRELSQPDYLKLMRTR